MLSLSFFSGLFVFHVFRVYRTRKDVDLLEPANIVRVTAVWMLAQSKFQFSRPL